MTVEIIRRFNSGDGGVFIVVNYDDPSEASEFVSERRAREIALDLLRDAVSVVTFEAIKVLVESDAIQADTCNTLEDRNAVRSAVRYLQQARVVLPTTKE